MAERASDEACPKLYHAELHLRAALILSFSILFRLLTIHGKGKKDRTVPLPETAIDELHRQMQRVRDLHGKDLAAGYAGVFLDDAVERKFPKAPRELLHQWFFPQQTLTLVEETGELRRHNSGASEEML